MLDCELSLRILNIDMKGIICKYMNIEQVVIKENIKSSFAQADGKCL